MVSFQNINIQVEKGDWENVQIQKSNELKGQTLRARIKNRAPKKRKTNQQILWITIS
jgi:hypothetical protein